MEKPDSLQDKSTGVMASMMMVHGLHTDFYYIVLPVIAIRFSESIQSLKYTISAFLIARVVSLLFLSIPIRKWGGRMTALVSLLLLLLGAAVGYYSHGSVAMLTMSRVLQSLGVTSLPVLSKGMMFKKKDNRKKKLYLYLALVMFSGPLVTLLCGVVLRLFSWQACYILILVVTSLVLIYYAIMLPEVAQADQSEEAVFARQWARVKSIFMYSQARNVLLSMSVFGALAVFFSVFYGFIFIHDLHFTITTATLVLLVNAFFIMLGSRIYLRFLLRVNENYILHVSTIGALVSGIVMLVLFYFSEINLFSVALPFFGIAFCFGMYFLPFTEVLAKFANAHKVVPELNLARGVLAGVMLILATSAWAWFDGASQLMYVPEVLVLYAAVNCGLAWRVSRRTGRHDRPM